MAIARPETKKQRWVRQMSQKVLSSFPDAKLKVTTMPDTRTGVAIWAYTSADWDDVVEVTLEDELTALEEDEVMVYVIPQPIELWED
jgi:hypothetical protein